MLQLKLAIHAIMYSTVDTRNSKIKNTLIKAIDLDVSALQNLFIIVLELDLVEE